MLNPQAEEHYVYNHSRSAERLDRISVLHIDSRYFSQHIGVLVLKSLSSSKGSDESAQMRRLTRASAARINKVS